MDFIERLGIFSTTLLVTTTIIKGLYDLVEEINENYYEPNETVKSKSTKSSKSYISFMNKSNTDRHSLPRKRGVCRICEYKGKTDWHHIISQHHAKKYGKKNLLTNPGNVVELCRPCHRQTTSAKSRYILEKKRNGGKKFWHF